MDRISLYVPPEEYAEVKAVGGRWDDVVKCWYVEPGTDSSAFRRWLPGYEGDEEFGILSERAFVAAASVVCAECQSTTEVICIYCESGVASQESLEPLTKFTVSNVTAMDAALKDQLGTWPGFKRSGDVGAEGEYFANYCAQCGAEYEDYLLHDEPGDVFFDIPHAEAGAVRMTALEGPVRLDGEYRFEV